jgi:hypothetical protein
MVDIMNAPLLLTRFFALFFALLVFLLAAAHTWALLAECLDASLHHQWPVGLPGGLHWMGCFLLCICWGAVLET